MCQRRRRWWLCTCSVSPCRPSAGQSSSRPTELCLSPPESRRSHVSSLLPRCCQEHRNLPAQLNTTQQQSRFMGAKRKTKNFISVGSVQDKLTAVKQSARERSTALGLFFFSFFSRRSQSHVTANCFARLPRLVLLPLCSPCINDSLTQNEEYYLRTRTAVNLLWFELKSPSGFFFFSLLLFIFYSLFFFKCIRLDSYPLLFTGATHLSWILLTD